MKRLALGMIVATVMSATLQAQDTTGTWQGSLQPPNAPNPLRIVMKISTEAPSSISGVHNEGASTRASDVSRSMSTVNLG